MTAAAPAVVAHGLSGRQDLPLPLHDVVIGAAVALVVSFVALGALWSTPRLRAASGVELPRSLDRALAAPATAWTVRVLGLVVCGWFLASAVGGSDVDTNPYPGAVFVLLWVGVVPLSVLLGPVWRAVSPLRTLHALLSRLLATPVDEGLAALPRWVGRWPAAAALFGFVWLELVKPDASSLPTLRVATALYAGVLLVGAAVFGNAWFAAADPFEAWSGAFGRLAPVARRPDGRLVLRNPLAGMTTLPVGPGTVGVVAVMLGSTAWDAWAGSTRWIAYAQTSDHRTLVGTAGLLGTVVAVGGAFWLATWASGGALATGGPARRELPGRFAHTLVPIALGYVVAHYFSFLVYQGQRTLILATDPLQRGSDLLGLRDRAVDTSLLRPGSVAGLQVVAVVAGHVVGVVLAHDRAVAVLDRRRAVVGQLPLLLVMVAYTVGGLLLLFHG
ncbi:hypothetical protein CLV35_2833 [Motilibacter peucedani]|uniref:Fenitrothion hydrolase n=1 Tax=Motilibacter peucedani TaxID=598650 RepID=A0A420XMU2_9ACTN|nr:hypothetical protein [Motilibacter peucedani]RKS72586.1 hypothetical protein CLV35_2833 [Motilibacter peucedani]